MNIKTNMMRMLLSFVITAFSIATVSAQAKLTPEQVAQKTAAVISNAKGLSATFSITGNGNSGNGTIKQSGNKFSVTLPGVAIWYNGKDLYTYSARTNETTVVNPNASELIESNPLLYVNGAGKNYTYSFSPVKRNGKYVVDLVPAKRKGDIKKLTFTVRSADFHPERIVVDTRQGAITIDIKDLKTNLSLSAGEFEYPKAKYPKAELVDLR